MLIDTHVLIWMLQTPDRLGKQTLRLLANTADVRVSILSLYELALKERLGKFSDFEQVESEVKVQSIELVPLSLGQMRRLVQLGEVGHKDPFDLGIVSLAVDRRMLLITADRKLLDLQVSGLQLIDARK